jgi:two-component system sensor histidine kinase EvgS
VLILDEIKRVHDDTLTILKAESINEEILTSLIHKIKGGAQLIGAQHFIECCKALEITGLIPNRVNLLIQLLEDQNQMIECYKAKYANN